MNSVVGDDLFQQIAQMRLMLDELKGRQAVGGDSTVIYRTTSADEYDRSASVSGFMHSFTIDFTSDRQSFPLVDLRIDVAIDSPTNPATFFDDYYLNVRLDTSDPALPHLTRWIVDLYKHAAGTRTFYLKATVISTDPGTIS